MFSNLDPFGRAIYLNVFMMICSFGKFDVWFLGCTYLRELLLASDVL